MLRSENSGMTLIEVLLATAILGMGLTVLMISVSLCMNVYTISYRLQKIPWVLGRGEMEYPFYDAPDPVEDLSVSSDSDLVDGFVFSREVEDDEDEDDLFVVRTVVSWGDTEEESEEIVRYIYKEL